MKPYRVTVVLGTRPEAIKLAPVILEMQKPDSPLHPVVCVTGQHRQMLDQVLEWFRLQPDHDLHLMQTNQGLADLSARALTGVSDLLTRVKPQAVMVQGDTTTAAMAGLAAFYQRIPVCHVEAGLRTGNVYSPFPEEVNRRLLGIVSNLHFAPTRKAAEALLAEGVAPASVFMVGNTVVDALRLTLDRQQEVQSVLNGHGGAAKPASSRRVVLVTAHRRESFGAPFDQICQAIRTLVERNGDIEVVYPVHLNPNVRGPVSRFLQNVPRIHLIEPVSYEQMVQLMLRSYLILTDSGGIQEEATVLGKPTLVMRDTTERQESLAAGTAVLVGVDPHRIISMAEALLRQSTEYKKMSQAQSPFGDGFSAQQIVRVLSERLTPSASFKESDGQLRNQMPSTTP